MDGAVLREASARITAASRSLRHAADLGEVSEAAIGSEVVAAPLDELGREQSARSTSLGDALADAGRMPERAADSFDDLDESMARLE